MKKAVKTVFAALFCLLFFSATAISATLTGGSFYYIGDNSVAPGKSGLPPGTVATAANFTNNDLGIAGVKLRFMLSAGESLSTLTINDFEFRFGNDVNPGGWAPLSLTGVSIGSAGDEVTIAWGSPAVKDGWLEVRYAGDQYLYFGNLVGDADLNGTLSSLDELAVVNHLNSVNPPYSYPYDINGDGLNSPIDPLVINERLNAVGSGFSLVGGPFRTAANAGPDQSVNEGTTVTLDASGSGGDIISYQWTQTSGPTAIPDPSWYDANPSFIAPPTGGETVALGFYLNVMDGYENVASDSMTVHVFPAGSDIVADMPTPAGDLISIQLSPGSNLTRFIVNAPATYTQTATATGPEPLDLPHGLTDIRITSQLPVTSPGTYTSTVTFFLPDAAPPGYGWAKLSLANGEWLDFSDRAEFDPSRTVVTVTLADNGAGDDNPGLGVIDDPSGLALMPGGSTSGGGGGNGDNCFIATAAYGSVLAPQVKLLRAFRDRFLMSGGLGRLFVDAYYRYSPPLAGFIARHDSLRAIVRWSLMPLIGFSWLALQTGLTAALAGTAILLGAAVVSVARSRRMRSDTPEAGR